MTDDEQIRKERNDQKRTLVHKIMKEAQAKMTDTGTTTRPAEGLHS